MAIEIRQPGAAKAAAQAGTIIGKGKRAEKEQVIAEQRRQQQVNIKARRAAEERAMQWELEKMEMRSQQEFQQELAAKQWEYERFNRAKAWEIEKMEMASRMDFQREEQDRQTKLSRIDTQKAAIEKEINEGRADKNDPKVELHLFNLEQQRIATEIGGKAPYVSRLPKEEQNILDAMREIKREEEAKRAAPAKKKFTVTPQEWEQAGKNKMVWLRDVEDSAVFQYPIEKAQEEVEAGRANWVASPIVSEKKKPDDFDVEKYYTRGSFFF
jgi:hypothetical protein